MGAETRADELTDVVITPPMVEAAVDAYLRCSSEGWDDSLEGMRVVLAEVLRQGLAVAR